jgi:peroxiredoxin
VKSAHKGTKEGRGAARQRTVRNVAVFSTIGIVVVGAVLAVIVTVHPTAVQAQVPATPSRDPAVSAEELDRAADAAGFRPTTATNVGIVETLPADTTLLAPSRSLLPVGAPAPDFTLSTPQGSTVRLSDYRGKTVLLEFFATWCPHCQAEAQHLPRIHASFSPREVAFLSVNADSEDAGSIHAFERWFKVPWPLLLDPGNPAGSFKQAGGAGPVTAAYGVAFYPTFYIIDPKGRIAWRNDREQPDALLVQQLTNASAR